MEPDIFNITSALSGIAILISILALYNNSRIKTENRLPYLSYINDENNITNKVKYYIYFCDKYDQQANYLNFDFSIMLYNCGKGAAKNIRLSKASFIDETTVNIDTDPENILCTLMPGEKLKIYMTICINEFIHNDGCFSIDVRYEDITDREYMQKITSDALYQSNLPQGKPYFLAHIKMSGHKHLA